MVKIIKENLPGLKQREAVEKFNTGYKILYTELKNVVRSNTVIYVLDEFLTKPEFYTKYIYFVQNPFGGTPIT